MINSIDEIIESYDDDIETSRYIELLTTTDEGHEFAVVSVVNIRIQQLNEKLELLDNTIIYSEQISKIKRILKSLNSTMFYEDETSYNNIIEYIIKSEITSDIEDKILNFIKEKRNQYLELQRKLTQEREQRKKLLEQQKESRKLEELQKQQTTNINVCKFNDTDFLSTKDLELLKTLNNLIYKNIMVLNSINDDTVKIIKESIKYKELDINLNSILPNQNISNYNNIVILFEIRKIINQINTIFEYIKTNNISNNALDKAKIEVSNYIYKINKLYSDYVFEEVVEEKTENKQERHVIYIKNSSGELLLKNDIKNIPENYKGFITMLEELKNGTITNNHEKDVRFTNNDKLSDVCKKKNYNARLAYCPCDDCYIVFVGFIKKNNNNNYENNLVKNRYSFYKDSIDNIIKDLSDPDKKTKLIEENDNLHNELMNYLKTNSRGSKKKELKKDLS